MDGRPASVKRTLEIEEFTNRYFIHPISRALVSGFARLGIHPNLVSMGGIVFGFLAAMAYYRYQQWEMALAGFLLMIGWHVMDGADGQLARLTGKTSELGKALDGLVDHLSFAMVYASLTLASASLFGNWVWWLALAAGVSHVVQATTYEFQRQSYDYWVLGKENSRPLMPEEQRRKMQAMTGFGRLFAGALLVYLEVQNRVGGVNARLVDELNACKRSPHADRMSEAYREFNLPMVKSWSVLCSNYRTIVIFASCLAGNALYFFLFEIIVLNGSLVALRAVQAQRNEKLLATLTHCGSPTRGDALATA